MKLFHYGKDGGPESTVHGFWLVEIKSLFSIALLCFENGSREAYHSHAFNSVSWLFKGKLVENFIRNVSDVSTRLGQKTYTPSLIPIYTPRHRFHKVSSTGRSWVLTFRGPWQDRWFEAIPSDKDRLHVWNTKTLTHGRRVVD